MSFLVRKINIAKWKKIEGDYAADAITHCLKTSNNTFSVWKVDTENRKDIDDAVLACITPCDLLNAIDIVILDSKYFLENAINIIESPGRTKVEDLVNKHRDLEKINFTKLGKIASHVFDRIESDKCIRYTEGMIKDILRKAILNKRLKKEDLAEKIRNKIECI